MQPFSGKFYLHGAGINSRILGISAHDQLLSHITTISAELALVLNA